MTTAYTPIAKESMEPWEDRFNSIDAMLTDILTKMSSSGDIKRKATILSLSAHLQAFGTSQFRFFEDKLKNGALQKLSEAKQPELQEYSVLNYPIPEYILSTIIRKIADDALISQRAWEQRMLAQGKISQTLVESDGLAQLALDALPLDSTLRFQGQPTVLTYLQRNMSVRIMPYAPVALVGIPASSIDSPRDRLAIAHEVAHYLYWHGKTKNKDGEDQYYVDLLDAKQPSKSDVLMGKIWQWREEIFADVVSIIIAGPLAGYSMLERQKESVGSFFKRDRGSHPPAAIRPYVHAIALEQLGESLNKPKLSDAGQQLRCQWAAVRMERGLTEKVDPKQIEDLEKIEDILVENYGLFQNQFSLEYLSHCFQEMNQSSQETTDVQKVEPLLQKLIRDTLSLFPKEWIEARFDSAPMGPETIWTQQLSINNPYAEIEEWFDEYKTMIHLGKTKAIVEFTDATPDNKELWENLVTERGYDINAMADDGSSLQAKTWLNILQFAGWTTEGPTGRAH